MIKRVEQTELNSSGDKCATFLIVISLLCASFKNIIPGLDFGDIVLIAAMGWMILNHKVTKFRLEFRSVGVQLLILYTLYTGLTIVNGLCLVEFSLYEVSIRLVRWLFYIMVVIFGSQIFDYRYGKKIIKQISITAAVVIIVQRIYIWLTGNALSVMILGKEIGNSVEYLRINGYLTIINRPSAFFSEPAHLTFFSVLGLIFILEEIPEKRNHIKEEAAAVLISIALLVSTSTYAYFLLIIVWMYFLIFKWKKSAGSIVLFLVFLIILLYMIFWIDWGSSSDVLYLIKKITSIGQTSRTAYFSKYSGMLPGIHQWIGVGVGNEEYYLLSKFGYVLGYVNSVAITYLYTGYAGFILWIGFWAAMFCSIEKKQWLPGWIAVVLALCSTDFYGKFSVLYFVVISVRQRNTKRRSAEGMVYEITG